MLIINLSHRSTTVDPNVKTPTRKSNSRLDVTNPKTMLHKSDSNTKLPIRQDQADRQFLMCNIPLHKVIID